MNIKKMIPCIYLYREMAVGGFLDVKTVVSMNPVELAEFYRDNLADELLVFDLSQSDGEHEIALDMIKKICEAVNIPVTGAGNIKRLEDVKKLLYAGCKKVALHYGKEENVALTQEASARFGKKKLAACVGQTSEVSENRELLESCVSEVIVVREKAAKIKEYIGLSCVPAVVMLPEMLLEKMLEILSFVDICGITGPIVNENAKEISALKSLCMDNGISVESFSAEIGWQDFKKNTEGLVPVVVQDYKTDEVLMVAYMNEESYEATLKTGKMTYFSRSRNELWEKGATSGHYQYVKTLKADCDMDTILAQVAQEGAACHTGSHSCFFNKIVEKEYGTENPLKVFESVLSVIKDRKINPKEGSYTNYLFDKGLDKILKKLGEEATEIVIAAKNPNPNEIKYEISDFLYHMMVLMVEKGISWEEITEELAKR